MRILITIALIALAIIILFGLLWYYKPVGVGSPLKTGFTCYNITTAKPQLPILVNGQWNYNGITCST